MNEVRSFNVYIDDLLALSTENFEFGKSVQNALERMNVIETNKITFRTETKRDVNSDAYQTLLIVLDGETRADVMNRCGRLENLAIHYDVYDHPIGDGVNWFATTSCIDPPDIAAAASQEVVIPIGPLRVVFCVIYDTGIEESFDICAGSVNDATRIMSEIYAHCNGICVPVRNEVQALPSGNYYVAIALVVNEFELLDSRGIFPPLSL